MISLALKLAIAVALAVLSFWWKWWAPVLVLPLAVLLSPNLGATPPESHHAATARQFVFYVVAILYVISQAILFQRHVGSWYGWLAGGGSAFLAVGLMAGKLEDWLQHRALP